jgi:hypothetical protein
MPNHPPQQNKQNKKSRRWVIILIAILIALIAASLLILRQLQKDGFDLSQINPFPFGEGTGTETPSEGGEITPPTEVPTDGFIALQRDRLRQITDFPVSGFRVDGSDLEMISQDSIIEYNSLRGNIASSDLETITQPITRYVRQADGNILETVIGPELVQSIVAQTLIPDSQEAFIDATRNNIVYRYYNPRLYRIETFLAQLSPKQYPVVCSSELANAPNSGEVAEEDIFDILSSAITVESPNTTLSELIISWQTQADIEQTGELDDPTFSSIQELCQERQQQYNVIESIPQRIQNGTFLTPDMTFVSLDPNRSSLFAIQSNNNQADGSIVNFTTPNNHQDVLEIVFDEWIPQWVNENLIALNTTTSAYADGFLFDLNPTTRKFEKVLGPEKGLSSLTDPTGRYVIYSISDAQNQPIMRVFDKQTARTYSSGINTLAEKCVWATTQTPMFYCGVPQNPTTHEAVPDDWYKGLNSFNDVVWRFKVPIEKSVLDTRFTFNPGNIVGATVDMTDLKMDPDNNFILFKNKTSGQLWSLEIDGLEPNENLVLDEE